MKVVVPVMNVDDRLRFLLMWISLFGKNIGISEIVIVDEIINKMNGEQMPNNRTVILDLWLLVKDLIKISIFINTTA